MLRIPVLSCLADGSLCARKGRKLAVLRSVFGVFRIECLILWISLALTLPARAVILWTDTDTTLARENGMSVDILGGAVKRDNSANDTLYFKFHVDPLSDKDTEEYFAAFQLFEGNEERLGIGNALRAWAYSAFFRTDETNEASGYIDLHTLKPEPAAAGTSSSYQYPRRGTGATIVFKVQYIPGEDDLVTVWLNPDLGPGANEAYQPEGLTTRFNANASFDEIRLRHSGRGGGWNFSDLAIATSFSDFVDVSSARPNAAAPWIADSTRAFTFRSWQKEQGLPECPVHALAQSPEGYIWIGGDDGLARFDGLRFVSFGIQEGIKTGPVSVLLDDRGALWIGSSDHGLFCRQNNQFTSLKMRDGLPADAITALAEDSRGRLWIGTDAGLTAWENGRLLPPTASENFRGRRITVLFKDRQGNMWIGAKGAGIFQYDGSKFTPLFADSLEELLKDAHCLLIDKGGRMWIGAGEDSVLCRGGDRWHHYRIPRNQVRSFISTLAEEGDGTIWAGSAGGGLVQFKDERLSGIPVDSGLAGKLIRALLDDREGKLWVGTDAGINRLQRKTLGALSQGEGLGLGAANGMAEVTPGVIWVAKPSDGLYRWDGKSFNRLSAAGLSQHESQITSLLVTHEGFCWVATKNSLLLYKDPIAAADEVTVVPSPKADVISLAEDSDGALWMGTREGKIWQLRENQWREQTNFFQTNAITTIAPDPGGSIWVGTEGSGLFLLANGSFQRIGGGQAGALGDSIRSLCLDAQGTLWIGTADQGLTWWRNGHVFHFTSREGLPDNNISQILEDGAGRLWLGSRRGIACVEKRRLDDLASGKIPAIYPQVFGRAEGMLSEECTGGFCPAGLKTRSGLLWFSTSKGVVAVNPRVLTTSLDMPKVVLEEILVDGVPVPMLQQLNRDALLDGKSSSDSSQSPLQIIPGKHRVEFRYTSVNFDAPDLIRFRYWLEGLDTEWVDNGTRRTAFYSYLPPGDYKFHVAASGNEGVWTDGGMQLRLVVLRHFWQTRWFNSVAGLCFIMAVVGAVRFVEKKKHQRRLKLLEQERALERERTRIAHDLHDEMGAKLCRISFLSEHARRGELPPEELHDQITSISVASREVLHSLDEIVWAVDPQKDTLEHVGSYIGQYAEEYFQMTGIQCELDIPTQLPPYPLSSQMRHQLFLATHEAITNILKHSGATHARISMKFNDSEFEIQISDDGKGFDSSGLQSGNGRPSSVASGDGLKNMCQRLADIGGRCSIDSAPGRGTHILFVIALKVSTQNIK